MPKKFAGINSKAAAAKARKDEKAEAERIQKQKEIDDAYWKDDDKSAQRKKDRKDQQEKKRLEQIQKKLERQKLEDEEMSTLKSKSRSSGPNKLTRAEISTRQAEAKASEAKENKKTEETHLTKELTENLNKVEIENEARTVEDAINVLSTNESTLEKHPEKRMKAAYEEFENERLPELKAENPNLRLSQLKQMLRKEWMKHPNNPFNKKTLAYNQKK